MIGLNIATQGYGGTVSGLDIGVFGYSDGITDGRDPLWRKVDTAIALSAESVDTPDSSEAQKVDSPGDLNWQKI